MEVEESRAGAQAGALRSALHLALRRMPARTIFLQSADVAVESSLAPERTQAWALVLDRSVGKLPPSRAGLVALDTCSSMNSTADCPMLAEEGKPVDRDEVNESTQRLDSWEHKSDRVNTVAWGCIPLVLGLDKGRMAAARMSSVSEVEEYVMAQDASSLFEGQAHIEEWARVCRSENSAVERVADRA